MATINPTMFHCFIEDCMNGVHNLATAQLKAALTNVVPSESVADEFSDITEISAGSGYTAGGENITRDASTGQINGAYAYVASGSITWESTGTIGPFQDVVVYDSSAANDELVSHYQLGTAITLNNGDSYTLGVGTTLFSFSNPT